MNKRKPVIEFRNVSLVHDYKSKKRAVELEKLVIMSGENIVILGPNGSGKTSFINLVTRRYYPEISKKPVVFKVFGKENWDIFELKNRLGMITPELQSNVNSDFTVYENILSGFFSSIGLWRENVTKDMKSKTDKTLEFLGIDRLKNRYMNGISTGEARLALIARALVHDPEVMLLDEPTSGLDMKAARGFRNVLRTIAGTGVNIILITHDLSDIIPEIGRCILLKKGKVCNDGPVEKVLTGDNLSNIFETKIRLVKQDNIYRTIVL